MLEPRPRGNCKMDMKPSARILDARPVERERLTVREFLDLSVKDRGTISDVQIVAPKLGSNDFGGVLVRYKNPIYKVG
jgi:hypothetical protein